MENQIQQTAKGVIISIKVVPKASKNQIVGWENGELKIRINAAPEKGEANCELVRFLANHWKIPQDRIILLQGAASRHKRLLLEGFDYRDLVFTLD